MELPSYSSTNRSPYISNNDDAPNRPSLVPNSHGNSQSRLSGQSFRGQDEAKNDTRPSYRQSPLSIEFSLSADGSVKVTESETDSGGTIKKDSNSSNVTANSNQFHFSIYKWASKGVPPMISLRSSNRSKLKENNLSRCLSSNGRMEGDSTVNELPTEALSDVDFLSSNGNVSVDIKSKRIECEKDDSEVLVKEAVFATPVNKIVDTVQSNIKSVPDYTILSNIVELKSPNSLPESVIEQKEKVTTKLVEKARKSELQSIRSLLLESDDGQGNDKTNNEIVMKEYLAKTTVMSSTNVRKRHDKKAIHTDEDVDKATLRMVDSLEGNKIKGKVKEFVNIFSKETPSKRVTVVDTQRRSFKWKDAGNFKAKKEVNVDTITTDEILCNIDLVKEKTPVNTSIKMDGNSKQSKEQDSVTESTSCPINDACDQKESSTSTASITDGSVATFESIDDFFDDNFSVKELSEDQNVLPQSDQDEDEFKASDAKIHAWSYGKETNIRSLLSTLQYVLWPESGWKPVPLVDIVEGNAVKRAYQRALLSLHPDKLQQKGVDAHKKYIAEQVFDKLQDAWIHFNSLSSL